MWTTIEGFHHLSKAEIDALIEAPALVTLLIGLADGELDQEERVWSERLLRARTYGKPRDLNEFYRVVVEGFWAKIHAELTQLPTDARVRNEFLASRLEKINPILAKLDPQLGADMYKGLIGLAEETAKASGGFLRIGAVSAAEAQWVKLPMITPIYAPKKVKKGKAEEEDPEEEDFEKGL